jgi:hypothetical protein
MVGLATHYHKATGKLMLVALVLLHVAAIVFYRAKKKQNLVSAMLHGDKELSQPVHASRDDGKSRTVAVLLFAACAAVVLLGVKFAG